MKKYAVHSDDNIRFFFKEGTLHVLGENERKIHGDPDALYFGSINNYPQRILLKDIKQIDSFLFPYTYHKLRVLPKTEIRKTITGGLKIKRKPHLSTTIQAYFSRQEYQVIKQYIQ